MTSHQDQRSEYTRTERIDWLCRDMRAVTELTALTIALTIVLQIPLLGLADINILALFLFIGRMISTNEVSRWAFITLNLAILIPWFLLVFVFRRNPFNRGPQRTFRYLCRWL